MASYGWCLPADTLSQDAGPPREVRLVKAMVLPAVMYGCESWTIKKAERRKIDAFVLRCWSRLLRVPCTSVGVQPQWIQGIQSVDGVGVERLVCLLM